MKNNKIKIKKLEEMKMSKWVCSVCGYEHDSEPAEDFKCPLCGLGKDVFEEVKESEQ